MEINNCSLLTLTTKRKNVNLADIALNGNAVEGYNSVPINEKNLIVNSVPLQVVEDACINIAADTFNTGDKNVDIFGSVSDSQIENICNQAINKQNIIPDKLIITNADITPQEISDIKQTIYGLNHDIPEKLKIKTGTTSLIPQKLTINKKPDTPASGGSGNNNDDGNNTENPAPTTPTQTKTTFLTNQYSGIVDTDSMFNYFHSIDSSITKSTGITRAQLIRFTQEDDYEDDNYDFFGTINRIFNKLDKNSDSKLTAAEIEAFIGSELGEDVQEYKDKVNQFAAEIQSTYSSLSPQQKLEYVLARTREYLEAAGLTKQIKALDRLTSEQDKVNTDAVAKKGQIVMTEFPDRGDGYITLGAYSSASFSYTYDDVNEPYKPFTGLYFGWDNDDDGVDRGITLNKILLDREWYNLVDTLVHELTHATAWLYYPNPTCEASPGGGYYIYFSMSSVDELFNLGVIDTTEYNKFKRAFNDYSFYSDTDMQNRLSYLLECQWGEYAAYQVDADYMDSIAGDIFDGGAAGADEKDRIISHINSGYNNTDVDPSDEDYSKEVVPEYKWWTYRGAIA